MSGAEPKGTQDSLEGIYSLFKMTKQTLSAHKMIKKKLKPFFEVTSKGEFF